MRSSTSASDPGIERRARRAAWLLLAGCAVVALGAEAAARIALDRISKIQHRTMDEYRLARAIGTESPGGRPSVLIVGNSLLDEGVRFERVRDGLRQEWDARRFVVENTSYYDWYYGLKRLFREGARPDIVIVV